VALSDALGSSSASMRRVAAEAFGRIGDADKPYAVGRLLRMPEQHPLDRVLEHSLIYALIEIDDPKSTAKGLTNRFSQRAALIALDQMDNGGLKPETVVAFLKSPDEEMRKAASWVASHHPEWGGALAEFFRQRLSAKDLTDAERGELR